MYIAALFTVTKLRNQPRCPSIDEWIQQMWYLYTMEFYSATKKNESFVLTGKCMELENMNLCDGSHTQKAQSHMISLIVCNIGLVKMQQCFETQVTLRGGHTLGGAGKLRT
jgi:hypothetical protein